MHTLFRDIGMHASLGRAIEQIGGNRFWKQLILLLRQHLPFDNALAIFYPANGVPVALEEYDAEPHAGPASMLAYLNGLYLLDPFYQACREGLASGLYRLEEIAPDHFRQSEYYLSYFHDNVLEDEVQFILQVPGQGALSLSLGMQRMFAAEDMKDGGHSVHRAVLWSLALVVLIEIVPLAALLIGAPSLPAMLASPDPIGYLLNSHGNETLSRLVSAGIFLSVFNAIVAIVIQSARVIFSSGRDALWMPALNRAFTRIHPRWESPWLATLFLAIPSAALSFSSNLAELTSFTVLLIVMVYLIVALCALFSRVLRRDREHPYRMPLWPLPALLAVSGAGYLLLNLFLAASARDVMIIVGLLAVSVILYCTYGKLSPAFQKL